MSGWVNNAAKVYEELREIAKRCNVVIEVASQKPDPKIGLEKLLQPVDFLWTIIRPRRTGLAPIKIVQYRK